MQAICLHQLNSAYDSGNLSTLIKSVHYASHLPKLFEPVLKAGTQSTLVEPVGDIARLWLAEACVLGSSDTLTKNTPFCPFLHAQLGSILVLLPRSVP